MIDLQVSTHFLYLLLQHFIRLERTVEPNRAVILAGGFVQEEINASVVYLFLDLIPFGEVEQVLSRNSQKKVYVSLASVFIVKQEGTEMKSTNVLEDVNHCIKLHRK